MTFINLATKEKKEEIREKMNQKEIEKNIKSYSKYCKCIYVFGISCTVVRKSRVVSHAKSLHL